MFCDKNFVWQKLKRKKNISSLDDEFDNNFRQMTHFFAHIRLLLCFVPCYHIIIYNIFTTKFIYSTRTSWCWFEVVHLNTEDCIVFCPFISLNVLKTVFGSAPCDLSNIVLTFAGDVHYIGTCFDVLHSCRSNKNIIKQNMGT